MKDILQSIMSKRTWIRVDEITGWSNKDKKKFLFPGGGPVPKEDILPMVISNVIVVIAILIIALIALNIFSLKINILLGVMLFIFIFLPVYLARIYFKDRDML